MGEDWTNLSFWGALSFKRIEYSCLPFWRNNLIHLERSGGFAGLRLARLAHDIDSTALSPEQEAELNNLIEQSHWFELPPVLRAGASRR
jgi:hypothetical protein